MQGDIDRKNSEFWDELCGSGLAKSLGINEINNATLKEFDKAYIEIYPYLPKYVENKNLEDKKVLEIGLGYGTLSQLLASTNCDYFGLDIATNPVKMAQYRLNQLGKANKDEQIKVGSALSIPHEDNSFDYVYSIGCLHHTGDLPQSISEVYRVLKPGGQAVIMLYNRNSFRQLVQVPWQRFKQFFKRNSKQNFATFVRSLYDSNAVGEAAPHTDYVSSSQVKSLFSDFSNVSIEVQNFDTYVLFDGKLVINRESLLNNFARFLGLDLYITAIK
ncbi:class I SAM-dependent methyltransferase [Pseudanabaena sp. Chao 1811]|uniref:class I SAM-dependent methyltransferase n=1 Tax=Pseudanabaena sp. Chao 1811 TaxID=2963092 RepID=UPI0022F39910|nr:class I SAM-dependent methyltransferase [Pseudanabaena sp. Chao 1811]